MSKSKMVLALALATESCDRRSVTAGASVSLPELAAANKVWRGLLGLTYHVANAHDLGSL